jgi:ATP synthase protein I
MHFPDARILRGAVLPTALVGVGVIGGAYLLAGGKGALGAALAAVLVIAFFSVTALALGFTLKLPPETAMLAGVVSYLVKVLAVMALVSMLNDVTAWDTRAFGWAVIILALTWIFAEFRTTMRRRSYIDDPAPAPAKEAAGEPRTETRARTSAETRAQTPGEARAEADRGP